MKRTVKTMLCVLLLVGVLATMLATYAFAANRADQEVAASTTTTYYNFYLSMEAKGVTDLATPRLKEHPATAVTYSLVTITNNTGYEAYINARDEAGTVI